MAESLPRRQNLRGLPPLDQPHNVSAPRSQCRGLLRIEAVTLVDTDHTGAGAGGMVQNGLDDL